MIKIRMYILSLQIYLLERKLRGGKDESMVV